jgi:curved DNA-binding protein CbpA
MITSHLLLGIPLKAGDDEIRSRYLELVKRHPPETSPKEFSEITAAYEKLKTKRTRIEAKLFVFDSVGDVDEYFKTLGRAMRNEKHHMGLTELFGVHP